jgi:cobalt/nickel transport protein
MRCVFRLVIITATWVSAGAAQAHYHILLADKPSVGTDEAVTISLRFGHPFEHQMFATQKPRRVFVVAPDGNATALNAKTERVDLPVEKGEPLPSYRWKFTPSQRGDYVFVVQCDPVWLGEEGVFLEDTVKVTVHVQVQKNWDAPAGVPFELLPLTRPYGLRAGMVFQTLLIGPAGAANGSAPRPVLQPLPGALVEVERYNATPPKELPPDEHVTRTVKTDPAGVATVTLTEAGWWAITAVRDGGLRERAGRQVPVRERTTYWVHVDDKIPLTPAK